MASRSQRSRCKGFEGQVLWMEGQVAWMDPSQKMCVFAYILHLRNLR